jgi:MarR family transcriptional regulator for hemolysin
MLLKLSRNDGCTQGELAQFIGIEAATLVRLVDHMEKEGLLTRRGSASDRRVKHLHLTEAGKKVVEEIRSYSADLRKEMMQGLSQEQIKAALDVLNTIRQKLGANA